MGKPTLPVMLIRDLLLGCFKAALSASEAARVLPATLPRPPRGRTLVVGGGKAAAAMAAAIEQHWPSQAALSGLVVTRYGHSLPTRRIRVIEAGHPLPDAQGQQAAAAMLDEIARLTPDDLLLVLLSGGASSLLALPVDGVSLENLRALTGALLVSGAPIQDINTVRKHLTRFSAGQVAIASPAPILALIISDVVGDNPADIASGPCAPDPGTFADAINVLETYAIKPPQTVLDHLQRGMRKQLPDTPKPGDHIFRHVENRVIACARQSLESATQYLSRHGVRVINLGEQEGEALSLAQSHASLLRDQLQMGARPFALVSGGESTVALSGPGGRGGRNSEYLLALGLALKDIDNIHALACDTDGIDGTEDNAGAIWTPDSMTRAAGLQLDASAHLANHDAYGFFQALGNLVVTGPTRTNVNDFRIVLAAAPA